jgi:hypothetical protein
LALKLGNYLVLGEKLLYLSWKELWEILEYCLTKQQGILIFVGYHLPHPCDEYIAPLPRKTVKWESRQT